jgi:hypothetical protein
MAPVEVERTLVKSPPELWSEIGSSEALQRWLGEVDVRSAEPPSRLEWTRSDSTGTFELVPSGWGTKVRVSARAKGVPWERVNANRELEGRLKGLLDHLGAKSLQRG